MCTFCLLYLVILPYLAASLESETVDVTILHSNTHLGYKVYHILLAEEKGNVIFSPFSLHAVLALLYSGSDGKTKVDLQTTLQLAEPADTSTSYKEIIEDIRAMKDVTLDIANKIYAAENFKIMEDFTRNALNNFDAETENINVKEANKTADTINVWVERKTHNRIKNLVLPDSITDLTNLILVNTLYFNGEWTDKFVTEKSFFYVSQTYKVNCTVMRKHSNFEYYEDPHNFQFIRLPYKNNNIRLSILLPNSRTGITELEKKIVTDEFFLELPVYEENIEIIIPKFKIENDVPLNSILQRVGLESIFEELYIDKIIHSTDQLVVSDVLQKVFIEVNENGTQAIGATAVDIEKRSVSLKFTADHPFLFFLEAYVEKKRLVLLQGRFSTPK